MGRSRLFSTLIGILIHQHSSAFPIPQTKHLATSSLYSTKIKSDAPYAEAQYNPAAASDFYRHRQVESLSRLSQIFSKSVGFVVSTVIDAKLKREDEMADRRGEELLELVSDLGPTFIKVSTISLDVEIFSF